MIRQLRQLVGTFKSFGLTAVGIDLADRILRRLTIIKIERVYVVTAAKSRCSLIALPINRAEAGRLISEKQLHCTPQALDSLDQGKVICIAVMDGPTLCGYTWYTLQPYRHSGYDFAFFDTSYLCGYGAYIHPNYRGKEVRSAIVECAVSFAKKIGRKGVLAAISWTNFASIKSALKLGYQQRSISYQCRWLKLFMAKDLYHLRTLKVRHGMTSAFIGHSITQVLDASYQYSALNLIIDTGRNSSKTGVKQWLASKLGLSNDLRHWATTRNIPYARLNKDNEREVAELIQHEQLELLISYGAPILSDAVIQSPRLAAVNIHPSLLPAYRGGSPLIWQLLREETETGATVHLLSSKVDQGAMLSQTTSDLPTGLSRGQVFALARTNAARALSTWLEAYKGISPPSDGKAQPAKSSTVFARNLTLADLHALLDWPNESCGKLFALARYLERWPSELMQPPGVWQWVPWKAVKFLKTDKASQSIQWKMSPGGLMFSNSRGWIILRPSFNPLRWLSHWRNWRSMRARQGCNVYL